MPQPITFETPELQSHEGLKSFQDQDSLGRAYVELETKYKSGSMDALPEEMRKDPAIAVFKSVSDLAKGFVETKKMVGAIEKAPGKPEEYKFTQPQNLHPGVKAEGIQKSFAGIFHKHGVGPKTADGIQQEVLSMLSNSATQQQKERTDKAAANETALRQEWGGDFEKNFNRVHTTLLKAAGKDASTAIEETQALAEALKGAPTLLKSLNRIFSTLSEDTIGQLGIEGAGDKPITDKAKAQERINELVKSHNKEIMDEKHTDHKKFKAEWDELQKVIGN